MKEQRTIPVTKGKTYEIEIIRLGTNGEGVGKYQDFTVFIPYALPGERIVAVITTVKKHMLWENCGKYYVLRRHE